MAKLEISILTPTYNRGHTLRILYESLINQTLKDFEWVIVDDGSEDETAQLVESFIEERKIAIRYFRQNHGGMHRAMNRGVRESEGEWLFKIDSDDYIFPETIEWLTDKISHVKDNPSIALVSGCRCNTKGESWVKGFACHSITTSLHDLVYNKRIFGEFAECFRGEVLRAYPWPEIDGEEYCDFSLVMYRMSRDGYKFQYFNEFIMVSEYTPGGLHRMGGLKYITSPVTTAICCCEKIRLPIPISDKIPLARRYWYIYNIETSEKKPGIGLRWVWLFPGQFWKYLKFTGKLKRLRLIVELKYRISQKLRKRI